MSSGIVERLRRALRSSYLVSVPDHPATGGNTGDTEWPPADTDQSDEDDC